MTIEGILIALLIGAVAGWLAGVIVKGAGFGLIGNIVIGILGALVASWLLPQVGLGFSTGSPLLTSILYATIGAIIILRSCRSFDAPPRSSWHTTLNRMGAGAGSGAHTVCSSGAATLCPKDVG